MSHARSTIRTALVAALVGITAAGSRVYTEGRVQAIAQGELPAVLLAFQQETPERITFGQIDGILERTISFTVTYIIKAASGYLDAADTACGQIEAAIAAFTGFKQSVPTRTLFDLDISGELPLYTAEITFSGTYRTTQGNPATSL